MMVARASNPGRPGGWRSPALRASFAARLHRRHAGPRRRAAWFPVSLTLRAFGASGQMGPGRPRTARGWMPLDVNVRLLWSMPPDRRVSGRDPRQVPAPISVEQRSSSTFREPASGDRRSTSDVERHAVPVLVPRLVHRAFERGRGDRKPDSKRVASRPIAPGELAPALIAAARSDAARGRDDVTSPRPASAARTSTIRTETSVIRHGDATHSGAGFIVDAPPRLASRAARGHAPAAPAANAGPRRAFFAARPARRAILGPVLAAARSRSGPEPRRPRAAIGPLPIRLAIAIRVGETVGSTVEPTLQTGIRGAHPEHGRDAVAHRRSTRGTVAGRMPITLVVARAASESAPSPGDHEPSAPSSAGRVTSVPATAGPASTAAPTVDVAELSRRVYDEIERRVRIERERRGQ